MKHLLPTLSASLLAASMLAAPAFTQQDNLMKKDDASSAVQGQAGTSAKTGAATDRKTMQGEAGASGQGTAQDKSGADVKTQAAGEADTERTDRTQAKDSAGMKSSGQAQGEMKSDRVQGDVKSSDQAQSGSDEGSGAEIRKSDDAGAGSTTDQSGTTAAGEQAPSNETTGSIDISSEQKTELHTVFTETKVEPADVDVDVSVGVAVPQTVELHPLPPRVVEIVPQYEGYEYFVLADGRIIIVQPSTYQVVYIIS